MPVPAIVPCTPKTSSTARAATQRAAAAKRRLQFNQVSGQRARDLLASPKLRVSQRLARFLQKTKSCSSCGALHCTLQTTGLQFAVYCSHCREQKRKQKSRNRNKPSQPLHNIRTRKGTPIKESHMQYVQCLRAIAPKPRHTSFSVNPIKDMCAKSKGSQIRLTPT